MTQEIRIGVVGLGGICRSRHIPGFKKIPNVRFCAVANRSRASSERAARDFAIPVVCDSWEELVDRDDVNTVLIGAWPNLHCEVSVAALKAGKHVFCQARMARNRLEAELMLDAALLSGKVAALCPVPIGMSIDKTMARILRNGDIGAVRHVGVRSLSNLWVDAASPMTWRKDHRLSGLNMQTLGMYLEVIHRWFGPTRSISADSFLYVKHRRDESGAFAEVHIPDQIAVNAVVDDNISVQYIISGVSGTPGDFIDIFGDKGSLHYDVNQDVLYRETANGRKSVAIAPEDCYDVENWSVEQDFVNAIRNGSKYHPNFEDGCRYMRALQAVHDSAAEGRRVAL